MVNASLKDRIFLLPLEEVMVHPFFKKLVLDSKVLDTFFPVSNLLLLGKLVQKLIDLEFQRPLEESGFLSVYILFVALRQH